MIKKTLYYLFIYLIVGLLMSCNREKVPLNAEQFQALLLEMHKVDATLNVSRNFEGYDELKNYGYYNKLFQKYGISREDFDSCMFYYSAQSQNFSKMYDFIIDSLNKELTIADREVKLLKANDSVNYFPAMMDSISLDTILIDQVVKVTIDSIVPGLYKFHTTMRFDSISKSRTRRISARFISADNKDTLEVRQVIVSPDTVDRVYGWSQYADSVYSRLEISYMEVIPVEDRPKVYRNGKMIIDAKNKKPISLKDFKGKAWQNQLFRPYISKRDEKNLKRTIRR